MPKRTRGTVRPGQRRPTARPATRPTSATGRPALDADAVVARRPGSLTAAEEARAAELEEQIRAEERAAEELQRRTRDRSRSSEVAGPRVREAAPLAVRASAEYAYVRRDIVRIVRIGTVMVLALAVLHVLINVMGVIRV